MISPDGTPRVEFEEYDDVVGRDRTVLEDLIDDGAYGEGWEDFVAGYTLSQNRYRSLSLEGESWTVGWHDAAAGRVGQAPHGRPEDAEDDP